MNVVVLLVRVVADALLTVVETDEVEVSVELTPVLVVMVVVVMVVLVVLPQLHRHRWPYSAQFTCQHQSGSQVVAVVVKVIVVVVEV